MSIVRLALVTSVTCSPPSGPPVRFQISQESMVPKSNLAGLCARREGLGTVLQHPAEFGTGEIGRQRQADVRSENGPARPVSRPFHAHRFAGSRVLPDDGVMRPACRSRGPRATVVSRWLVMPTAAISPARAPASFDRSDDHILRSLARFPAGHARPSPAAESAGRAPAARSRRGRHGQKECSGCWWCPGRWQLLPAPNPSAFRCSNGGRILP